MDMKQTLLIVSVFMAFTLGHGELKVSLFPAFPSLRVYVGDELTLRCKDGRIILQSGVTWFYNGKKHSTNATLYFPAVTKMDSGQYQCNDSTQQSKSEFQIDVLEMLPEASLSVLNQANTVISKGDAVLLKFYHHAGIVDWGCRYAEGGTETWVPIKLDSKDSNTTTIIIHADVGEGSGRTYWCINTTKGLKPHERPRSNAIKLIATENMVRLQMSESPALLGDNVTVTCDVWGSPQIDSVVFYKNGAKLEVTSTSIGNKFTIQNISDFNKGWYSCSATYRFTHISKDAATHSNLPSDEQVLRVVAGPHKTLLNCESMTCEGLGTNSPGSYVWYHTPDGQTEPRLLPDKTGNYITFTKAGKYACSAYVAGVGFFRKSKECLFKVTPPSGSGVLVVVVMLFVVGLVLLLVALFICKRRSNASGRKNTEDGADGGYEEVGKKEGGGEYELLKRSQEEKDKGHYETLKGQGKGEGEGEGKGEYEALKVGEAESSVYHTLKEQGQGQGEYEALKSTQAEVYHTLKDPGQAQAQGQGEYEALKSTQAEVYHTLKDPGKAEAQGQGEYEALKTTQAEVYHTLGQGAGAGPVEGQGAKEESPYEELKKEKEPQ